VLGLPDGFACTHLELRFAEALTGRVGGRVIKPETINYRTYEGEAGGLFDGATFGRIDGGSLTSLQVALHHIEQQRRFLAWDSHTVGARTRGDSSSDRNRSDLSPMRRSSTRGSARAGSWRRGCRGGCFEPGGRSRRWDSRSSSLASCYNDMVDDYNRF
jgi:hypothetical protein